MKTWDKRPELQVPRYPENLLKTATKEVNFITKKKNLTKNFRFLLNSVFPDLANIQ